jgi:hypothetical protein
VLVDAVLCGLAPVGFYITDGDDVGDVLLEEVLHYAGALTADADAADYYAIARCDCPGFTQGR